MARKRKPSFDPNSINPADVVGRYGNFECLIMPIVEKRLA